MMDVLLAVHRPGDPAEATLVLAAVSALCGLACDGKPMAPGPLPVVTLRQIAAELGLPLSAVRRGLQFLGDAGALGDGLVPAPATLQERWREERQRIRLPAWVRRRGLRAGPLLLAGFVAGQQQRGRLVLGIERLSDRLGTARRTLQRDLTRACRGGAVRRWTIPGSWQLCLAMAAEPATAIAPPAPACESGAREAFQSGARERREDPAPSKDHSPGGEAPITLAPLLHAEPAAVDAGERSKVAHPPSQSGTGSVPKWRTPPLKVAHARSGPERSTDPSGVGPDVENRKGRPNTRTPERRAEPDRGEVDRAELVRARGQLVQALLTLGYRQGFGSGEEDRKAEVRRMASRFVLEGLREPLLHDLVRLAKAGARVEFVNLLAHWLDEGLWREVLDEQAMKAKQMVASDRPASEPKLAHTVLPTLLRRVEDSP